MAASLAVGKLKKKLYGKSCWVSNKQGLGSCQEKTVSVSGILLSFKIHLNKEYMKYLRKENCRLKGKWRNSIAVQLVPNYTEFLHATVARLVLEW